MLPMHWLTSFSRRNQPGPKSRRRRSSSGLARQTYQPLEPRRLLAVWVVDTLADRADFPIDGLVSLREAIEAANTNTAVGDAPAGDTTGDTIFFASHLAGQTIGLTAGEFLITEALAIRGGPGIELDAQDAGRLFHISTDQEVVFSDLRLTNGNAEQGSGIYVAGGGQFRGNRLHLAGNGKATDGGYTLHGEGGGIFNAGSHVSILNSRLEQNVAGEGGGIFSSGGSLQVIGTELHFNHAAGVGGAIAIAGGQAFIANSDIFDNWATDPFLFSGGGGGGLFIGGSQTTVLVDSTRFAENQSGHGGGIYNSSGNTLTVRNGSQFESNEVFGSVSPNGTSLPNGDGGGIANFGQLRVRDSQFVNNRAGFGGAVYSQNGIGLLDQIEVLSNRATRAGGGIAVRGGEVSILNSSLGGTASGDGNAAFSSGFHGEFGSGGGLALLNAQQEGPSTIVRLVDSRVAHNQSYFAGGGISVASRGFLYAFAGTTVRSNLLLPAVQNSVGAQGGGIFNEGVLQLNDVTISGNHSPDYGGGLAMAGGWARIGNSTISGNQADHAGGGLSLTGGMTVLYRTTLGGTELADVNLAGTYGEDGSLGIGGGAYLAGEGTRLRLIESRVASNTATLSGGGIYNDGGVVRAELQTYVSGNRTLREDGGGIFNQGGHLELTDTAFLGNTSRNGGGIFNEGGSVHLTRSRLQLNAARRTGGGMFNRGYLRILDTLFINNSATYYPDLYDAGP